MTIALYFIYESALIWLLHLLVRSHLFSFLLVLFFLPYPFSPALTLPLSSLLSLLPPFSLSLPLFPLSLFCQPRLINAPCAEPSLRQIGPH